jgi:putative peptidoglycan lipid II flippase
MAQAGTTGRAITIASAIMMGSVMLSRIMGIAREMVLAGFAGTSGCMDAYVAAFLLPEILNHLLAGGFMSITFIPIFQKHFEAGNPDRAWRAFSNLFNTGSIAMVCLIATCWVFAGNLLGMLGKTVHDPAQLVLAVKMTRIILPAQLFFYWGALFMAVQFAHKRFLFPALAPIFYNGGIIAGGLLLGPRLGIEGFAWGVLAGAIAGNAVIQIIGLARLKGKILPVVDLRDPDLITYLAVTIPLVLGLGMQFSNEAFFRIFGSFAGTGGMAALNYGLRVMWMLVGIFGQAVGIASFPFLSQLAVQGKLPELNKTAFNVLRRVGIFIVPVSLVLMACSQEAVAVLFQRGKFTAESTALTAQVLQWYLVGAFAFSAITLVSRCFYAIQNTLTPMLISTASVVVCLPAYWLFGSRLGPKGIALAGSISAIVQLVALAAFWVKKHGDRAITAGTAIVYIKACGAGIVGAGACLLVKQGLRMTGPINLLAVLPQNMAIVLIAGAVGISISFLIMKILGVEEAGEILKKTIRR